LTWEKLAQSGEVPSFGRYGHTAVFYNKKMFIFGGEKKYNSHLKQHECLNDVRYFSLGLKISKKKKYFIVFLRKFQMEISSPNRRFG